LSYDQYLSLLLSAAAAYDNQFAAKKAKRQVFSHEQYDAYDDHDNEDSYDIDAPVSLLLANATDRYNKRPIRNGNRSVHMSKDKWHSLNGKNKEIWDKLDDKAKSIILGYDKSNAPSRAPNIHPSATGKPSNLFQH